MDVGAAVRGWDPRYGDAISSVESGGRYDLLGPVTRNGDRAFGKYQIMGANIGPWSQEALGRALTPQEFLADKDAQEAVFQHRFGRYVQKYGPEGASRAWFAGEGGMNDPNRKDILGTTVAAYADKFNRAYGAPSIPGNTSPVAEPTGIGQAITAMAPSGLTFVPAAEQSRPMPTVQETSVDTEVFAPRTFSRLRAARGLPANPRRA